jgi:hypothetical protein
MRKLHLLQAEWRSEWIEREKQEQERTYLIMSCWMSGDNIPTKEELFPLLSAKQESSIPGSLLTDDDKTIFSQIDAVLEK